MKKTSMFPINVRKKRAHIQHDLYGTKTPRICHLALLSRTLGFLLLFPNIYRGIMPPEPPYSSFPLSALASDTPKVTHNLPPATPLIGIKTPS